MVGDGANAAQHLYGIGDYVHGFANEQVFYPRECGEIKVACPVLFFHDDSLERIDIEVDT